jgi:hypothetical protein
MRKSFVLVAALLAAVVPSLASAAVQVNIGGPSSQQVVGSDTIVSFEVFATDLDGSNERLNAYTIAIEASSSPASGVGFVVPGSSFGTAGRPTAHPYVFKDLETIPPIENFGSTPTRLQFGATAIAQEDEVNIDSAHNGFLKVSVRIPATAGFGTLTLAVDPRALSLAGLGAPIVATPGNPGVIFYPEPSAAALLLFPSLALLRRTRRGRR